MSYTCCQKIIVIEDPKTCNKAFDDYILAPALQFIGLDCEWNTNRPVSLLQVATPTVVLLVRVCHLNFILPSNVKLVLEDPTIYKVGVNIENDSEKLGEDCFCKIKSWVDLRHVAIRSVSWGPCLVEQVNNQEFNLKFYDQADPKSESAKTASGKRLSWCPKMGLESLISDCLDQKLPKNTSARWSDDWEIKRLQPNQQTYAANDATAALDIFIALVYTSVMGSKLPLPLNFDVAEIVDKHARHLEDAVKGLLDIAFMQTKEDMAKIYKMIEATDPQLNIKGYYTKPPPSKSKLEKKEIYKKKAKEALAPNSLSATNSFSATQHTTPQPLLLLPEPETSSLDTSKSSFTFKEITDALQHTKPNSKTLTENFLNMQSDREESNSRDDIEFSPFQILFYFKHTTNKKAPLIPGFSYGRGSKPPNGYRRFRSVESQTQTDFNFDETNFKKVYPSNKSSVVNESERSTPSNTDYSFVFKPPPINRVIVAQNRTESPLPHSTTDDDGGSESSCTSSNYHSSVSKQSKSKGRGRGRGKAAPSIGSSRNEDSGSEVRKGRGRGRGAVMLETRAPKTGSNPDSDNEKFLYNSSDVRYQDAQEHPARPSAVELADHDRLRRPTTSSVSSAATVIRQQSAVSEHTPDITTPTNSFANAQPQSNFEDAFFETTSNYSTFSIQDLMRPSPATATRAAASTTRAASTRAAAASFNTRGYSGQNQRGSYHNAAPTGQLRSDSARTSNPYKATNRGHINEKYEYKTDIFRQAVVGGLHTGSGLGFSQPRKEEIPNFDWGKYREDTGIGASETDEKETSSALVDLSCSDSSDEGAGE